MIIILYSAMFIRYVQASSDVRYIQMFSDCTSSLWLFIRSIIAVFYFRSVFQPLFCL